MAGEAFDLIRLLISFVFSVVIGGLGYWRRSLTGSGWLGAIIVGTASAGLGGWTWGVLVVVFFVTSSALSHWRRGRKERVAADKFSKTEQRDLAQTLANGGAITIAALLYSLDPQPGAFAFALGAIATVTADTWATEVGTLSAQPPRLITNFTPVAPGTSGAITLPGTTATLAGSLAIGLAASIMIGLFDQQYVVWPILLALLGGTVGSLSDSLMGATVQAMRWCPHCQVETERMIHRCGTPTVHQRGWRWLDNDWVNFLSSLLGGGAATLAWLLMSPGVI